MAPGSIQELFGLRFVADASIADVAAEIVAEAPRAAGWRCVVTPNVDHLVRYDRNAGEAAVAARSTWVLPDGMPIVWASRLVGRPLRGRLTGSDLFGTLWPMLASGRVPVVAIASTPAVAERLEATHGAVTTFVPELYEVSDEAAVTQIRDWIDTAVRETVARIVVIGVSMPKHHQLADRLWIHWAGRDDLPIVMLLGASADLALGLTRRAPRWMQRAGLEWLFRLALEPRRLARRYLVDDVRFAGLLWREWRAMRAGNRH
jgi:N-acetylglucosaminyldiphosphoundecaprenol N-acetyl-beta-D-mannosaminyltransferase